MVDVQQEKPSTEVKAKGPALARSESSGNKFADKRRENKQRKKIAHRRTIARSNTTG